MFKAVLIATLSALSLSGSTAMAQDTAPVCTPQTLNYGPFPDGIDLTSYAIDPVQIACTSKSGPLTLLSVSAPAKLTADNQAVIDQKLVPGQSVEITFTVSDANGQTATSTIKINRN